MDQRRYGRAALALFGLTGGLVQAQPVAGQPVLPRTRVEAGVRVMEHGADVFARAPRLVLQTPPLAVAGGPDAAPEHDLTWAGHFILFADGRLASLAMIDPKVTLWSAAGSAIRTVGRTGQGPGEFTAPHGMALLRGDTILVPDFANARLNWILPDGRFIRMESLAEGRLPQRTRKLAGVLPSGDLVLTSVGYQMESSSAARTQAHIALLPRNGRPREIASVADMDIVEVETRYGGRARMTVVRRGLSRGAAVAAWDTLIAAGDGEGYRLELLNGSGKPTARIQVAVPRRAVTAGMRRMQIDRELARLRSPHRERMIDPAESERQIREQPFADSLPPYEAFFTTEDGTLWITDPVAPGDSVWSATAFRRDGAIMGRLQGSGGGTPVAFGRDRVAVRVTDEDGIVSIRIHRIVPARR